MIVDKNGNMFQDRRKKENQGKTVKQERRKAEPQVKERRKNSTKSK